MSDRCGRLRRFAVRGALEEHASVLFTGAGEHLSEGVEPVLLIDWELIGIGSPALDVARFIALTLDLKGDLSAGTASLPNYYFERYVAQGGTQLNKETWQRSYDLATLFINLWQFPFWAGWTVGEDPTVPEHFLRDIEMIRQKTEHTTGLMRRWLGR